MALMDLGLSHEVNSAEVMSKEVAANVLMGATSIRAYETLMISGMKVASNLDHSSICLIFCALDYEVTPSSPKLMDIKEWKAEGRSKQVVVLIIRNICHLAAWRLLLLRMEAGSSSAVAPVPKLVDKKIREVKHELKSLQTQVNAIDYNGGRRLEHVNKDSVFLRKKIKRKVKRTKKSLTR